jgi:hypothetical protein
VTQESVRVSLNCAIEALLAEGPLERRLANASSSIAKLEQYRSEIPDDCLDILKEIVGQLAAIKETEAKDHTSDVCLSSEQELALTEELLSLYIITSGGSLAF